MFPITSSASFSALPLDPSLVSWIAADNLYGVNSTLPADGANVEVPISDLSGSSNQLISNSGTAPVFRTNVENSKPGFQYTAVTTRPISGPMNNMSTLEGSAFVVSRTTTTALTQYVFRVFSLGADTTSISLRYTAGANITGFAPFTSTTGSNQNMLTNYVIGEPYLMEIHFGSGLGMMLASNGSDSGLLGTASAYNISSPLFVLGAVSVNAGSLGLEGYMFETLYYKRRLSAAEVLIVRNYLNTKYAIY